MQVLGIALSEGAGPIAKMRSFRKKHGITYPLLLDEPGTIIQKFGFDGIPQDVVIDKSGKYVSAPTAVDDLAKALNKLLK